ncbi:TRAP transporter substrate-binding protein [Azospirillum halopraeferens]|uniref:TRAP transporter substrate-binding protein n=1 Tax=Azospirillum halopraeferens TaxID=34010 RepID=UPI00040FF507|nr:TRAP transporter substrate-binding protein [Azospirillum halopraeferens]
MRILTAVAALGAVLAPLVGTAAPAAAEEIKIGLITPPQHVWTRAAQHFADRLKEKSGGALTAAIFPGGQLGNEPEMFQQMQTGLLDMGIMTASITSLREPSITAWFTPFLFADVGEAVAATRTPAAGQMLDNLKGVGLQGLGYTFAGMRHILMRDAPAQSLDDLKGKKIRIVPFPAMKVWWEAAGAVPTPVHLPEIYQSLQNGLLDGVDIDLDALVGSRFQDVAKGLTVTSHMAFPAIAVYSGARWQTMTPERRELIRETMAETLEWANTAQIEAERRNLESLQGALRIETLADARERFARANDAFAAQFGGQPLVKAFREQAEAR